MKSNCPLDLSLSAHALGVLLVLAGVVHAAPVAWNPAAGSQDWFGAANWTPSLPTSGDVVTVSGSPVVQGASTAVASSLNVNAGTVTVGDISAGLLNVAGQVTLAGGRLNLSFGTLSLNTLAVGSAGTYTDSRAGTLALTGSTPGFQLGAVSVTVNAQITGTSGLTLAGAGTLVIANNSLYSGPTSVGSSATLAVGNGGTTGALGAGDINDAGTVTFNRADNITIANVISGVGRITQSGGGTLTLTGANTFSGGTTIAGGVVQVGNGGATGALGTGDTVDNGTLVFNRADNVTYAGAVSGSGSLVHLANSTLTLLGNNTYSGSTTVTVGTLLLGAGGTSGSLGSGNVVVGGTLAVNRSDALTLSGLISGTGGLSQIGTGTLTLLGNNTYTGATIIAGGTLQVGNGGTTGQLGSGNVTNGGALSFNRSDLTGVSGVISGPGSLTQNGTGTLVLAANNTYSGSTTINAGTLQVGTGGTVGSLGTGAVVDNGTLIFGRTDQIVVANPISGSGAVQQAGGGVVILTGNNTYAGGTQINAGTVQIGSGGTIGSLGTGATTNNGQLVLNRSDTLTVDSAISGLGSVTQAGGGTAVLTANNTYSGTTVINSGTLQVGNGGTTGTLGAGNVTNNGTLTFNRSDSQSLSSTITGSGGLIQAGTGTLIITANNTYAGSTLVASGILQVGAGGNSGALGSGGIVNNARLIFNRSDAVTVSGVISGSGSVAHAGTGTLTVAANNSYSGGTSITGGGTLRVVSGLALGTGDVNVTSGMLQVDSNSATSRTTLAVGGNYAQSGAGTLQVGVAGAQAGGYDQVQIGGKAALGGTLQMVAVNGYRPLHNTKLTFLSASGGVTGQFSSVVGNFTVSPMLSPSVVYGLKDVSLVWVQTSFQGYATTRNQQSVAGFLDSITASTATVDSALVDQLDYGYVTNLKAGLASALELIAPTGLTAIATSAFAVADIQSEEFLRRADELLTNYPAFYSAALRDNAASPEEFDRYVNNPWTVYLATPFSSASVKATSEAKGYDLTTRGATIGVDRKVGEHFFGGFSAGYASTKARITDGSSLNARATSLNAYGILSGKGLHLLGLAGATVTNDDSSRISLGGVATAKPKGVGYTGLAAAGYDWKKGGWHVGTQLGLQYTALTVDRFTETGSLSPLSILSQSEKSSHVQGGLNLRYHNLLPVWTVVTPQLYVGWRHEMMGDQVSLDAQSSSGAGSVFRTYGPKLGTESVIGGAGLSVQWRPTVNAFLNYSKQFDRSGYDADLFQFGGRVSF
jgi:autotransporter-associated beta strand protein